MKKLYSIYIFLLLMNQTGYAQLTKTSWALGFGFSYPRFQSTDVQPADNNYGGFLSLQRKYFENAGLRFIGSYRHINGISPDMFARVLGASLDLIYFFDPCSPASLYAGLGLGAASFETNQKNHPELPLQTGTSVQVNLMLGCDWKLSSRWDFRTEFGLHTVSGTVDGIANTNRETVFGSSADLFVSLDVGFQYYFMKGEPSRFCDMYEGLNLNKDAMQIASISISDIEKVIRGKALQPAEIDYKGLGDILEKLRAADENMALAAINFKFNRDKLLPEALPVLEQAAELLKNNPSVSLEIHGHADSIGTERYNQVLSEKRAQVVRKYLAGRGVDKSRISTIGFGEQKPVSSNDTASGREKNRRVEFRVITTKH